MKKIVFDSVTGLSISAVPISRGCTYDEAKDLARALGGRLLIMDDISLLTKSNVVSGIESSGIWMEHIRNVDDAFVTLPNTDLPFSVVARDKYDTGDCFVVFEPEVKDEDVSIVEQVLFRVDWRAAKLLSERKDLYWPTLNEYWNVIEKYVDKDAFYWTREEINGLDAVAMKPDGKTANIDKQTSLCCIFLKRKSS